MKFGVCTSIEQAHIVHEAGFDFVECTVVSLKPEQSDAEFQETLDRFLDSPVPVEAFNILLPRELKIVGPSVDTDRIRRYLEKALERVKNNRRRNHSVRKRRRAQFAGRFFREDTRRSRSSNFFT